MRIESIMILGGRKAQGYIYPAFPQSYPLPLRYHFDIVQYFPRSLAGWRQCRQYVTQEGSKMNIERPPSTAYLPDK